MTRAGSQHATSKPPKVVGTIPEPDQPTACSLVQFASSSHFSIGRVGQLGHFEVQGQDWLGSPSVDRRGWSFKGVKAVEEEEPLIMTAHNQASRLPQYIAAIAATLGGFVMGSQLGWTSPTKTQMFEKYHMEDIDWSWVGGILSAGAMVGALSAGYFCDMLGRRMTIMLTVVPCTIGWAMILWAPGTWMVILGRGILGAMTGVLSVASPLYTNEIAETAIRGTLGTMFQLQVTIGILFSYIVGAETVFGIRVFAFSVICAAIPFVLTIAMFFMPETPTFYLKKGNKQAAKESLQKLRGSHYDVNEEINQAQKIIEEIEAQKMSFSEAFSTTAAKKGLCIGLVVMFLQQFSGINGVIFYASDIFKSAGSSLDENIATIITGIVSVAGTFLSTQIIDRLGRKPLLFVSDVFMSISAAILGIYFFLQQGNYEIANNSVVKMIPLIAVCAFIVMFAIGFGPIPWMFIGEIFPPAIKGPASSIACLFNWICAFAVSFGFPIMKESLNGDFTFWIFAAISACGAVFVVLFIPETKGRSIEEVQRILGGESSDGSNATIEAGKR
ncbi:transporter [Nesidiocoris tenuis]|uniref:Transporter n=1 Tax=Nesidiocoris tenuis TaxID=355587 RepID=A0ABN7AX20_9HEMI|nr:transporter [Nesidiocoris tenuis]